MEPKQQDLQKGLLPRHVQFMALAGMIGTGIFKGSSETLNMAGPSVIIAYLIGGLLLFIVMAALAEMASAYPNVNVQGLVYKAFGYRPSFIIGWLYWVNWILVITVELIAGASFLQYWFPDVPLWALSLVCTAVIVGINLFPVKHFGEMEFWFAGIKILALTAFIILGALILFGAVPSSVNSPITNLTGHGGIFPNGFSGMFAASLVVIFSYGGAELIGVAVSETKDAKRVLPKVVKGTVLRVILFYALPILIICGIMPWNQVTSESSPFVQVFDMAGIPGAANVMNFVLVTAVLSAANSGIYATSRTLYSLAKNGEAPKQFTKISKNGIPLNGIMLGMLFILAGVFLSFVTPENVIGYLMTIPGFTIMIVWICICAAQLKLRKQYKDTASFRVKWHPYTTLIAIVALSGIFISFIFNADNIIGTIVCLVTLAVITISSFIFQKNKGNTDGNAKQQTRQIS
ncbi:amino acid permease [Bacillus sp. DNRA2]|uniref:amino acid permease n=1 Tax=Bacillus sp. DNRA2 TaxID=2723053 RepID=UPI00145DA294|nr:amino acid permease [Bacillus sp. DNRA2]NMD71334.1 amino acid permease [Bacillus sp. DNRA2]